MSRNYDEGSASDDEPDSSSDPTESGGAVLEELDSSDPTPPESEEPDFSALARARMERGSDFDDPAYVLETIDDGVYVLDESFTITAVNEAVMTMTGYDRDDLVGSHVSLLAGDDTISMADEMVRHLRSEGDEVGWIDTSIRSSEGESIPIETRFSSIELDDGSTRQVGVVRDVADRRRYEEMLAALNRSARQMLRAEDATAVYECLVYVVASVISDASVVAYRYENADTVLQPVASHGTEATARQPGTDEWEAFAVAGDSETENESGTTSGPDATFRASQTGNGDLFASFDPADDVVSDEPSGRVLERHRDADGSGDGASDSDRDDRQVIYAALDEFGLLAIELPAAEWYENASEFVELLAANAVAALGRVERESELALQREALMEREERLTRLHEFNDLLRRINDALVDAETVEEVATDVCDLLTTASSVNFAWIAEPGRDGVLRPLARAGQADGYLADLPNVDGEGDGEGSDGIDSADRDDEPTEPTALAAMDDEPVVVSTVSDGLRSEAWRGRALSRGFQSVVSVPIAYNDVQYGVLSVYADSAGEFDGAFGEMLAELGTTAANAINGIETRRSLRCESTTELDLRITDPDAPLPRIADALGTSVRFDGVVPDLEGGSLLYVTAGDELTPLEDALPDVEGVRSLGGTVNEYSAEVRTYGDATTVAERLTDLGAAVEVATADADGVDVTVSLPRDKDVRSVVETLSGSFESVDLRARCDQDAALRTAGEFLGALEDQLTDRQYETARTAYLSGYFDWPRASSGEDVAAALDIAQPTFSRHLRTAERKVFDLLFGADGDADPEN
ncbi:PAS domain S-box protein [Halostella sp. JP-L12]|uniref:bacterio-opsin activator domain-containing protein n=1 Tax=Halostella TaxID=1843185 RepID=UPI000EF788AF|nr:MULTISPECIES: bacterio-opsin activator domain-containing protein [Halostella]NHN49877.1 PAS domain S-box protein [Halostella sp. JP-L12]